MAGILIDGFQGHPQEYYNFVIEEINRREIPGIEYSWAQEGEEAGLLKLSGVVVNALQASFRGKTIRTLAYQFAKCFVVSTRVVHNPAPNSKTRYLHDVAMACFEETVRRSTQVALKRHLEARSAPVPSGLDPQEVFFSAENL